MKIVFLDRDGVVNKFPGLGYYVTKVKDFHILPGVQEAIRTLTKEGYTIFIISNQAGVGKGVFSQAKLKQIDDHMIKRLEKAGGKIKKSYYCTHAPDAGCDCRKPGIGLMKQALKSVKKDISDAKHAFFVGDAMGDIEAGHKAGCKTIFVLCGRKDHHDISKWPVKPDFTVKDLKEAVELMLGPQLPNRGQK